MTKSNDREGIIRRFLANLAKSGTSAAGTATGTAIGGTVGGPIGAAIGAMGGAIIDTVIAKYREKPDVAGKLTEIRAKQAAHDIDALKDMLIEAAGIVDDRTELERLAAVVDNPDAAPNEPLLREAIERLFEKYQLVTDDPAELGGRIVSASRLPLVGEHFLGRDERMAELDAAWADGALNVLSLRADGGVGKTSLIVHWLNHFAEDGFRGAERVFAWSFYSQGTSDSTASAEPFINEALEWFGDPKPQDGSPWNRGVRLADLVRKSRTLLILDGFEPMQHPEEQLDGRVREQSLQALIKELAAHNPGLLLITTRLKIADLNPFHEKTAKRIDLEMLSPEACVELLRRLNVNGTDDEMEKAAAHFNHHALSIQLLGNYIAQRYDDRDIRHWTEVSLLEADEWDRNHATKVMQSYEKWFADENCRAELAFLHIIGLFNRPAGEAEISALLEEPAIEGLTDALIGLSETKRLLAFKRLRDAGLLLPKDERNPGVLDAHPLVREHFGERLRAMNEDAYKAGHSRLFDYLTGPGCAKELPDTLEEMAPLYAAIPHGCKAGRQQESLYKVFHRRIRRSNEHHSLHKLGAFGSDLAALASFFDASERPWSRPASIFDQRKQSWLLNDAAFSLRASGRFGEAVEPMRAGLDVDRSLVESATENREYHWRQAAIGASNLSQLLLALGRTQEAIDSARQSVDHADRSGNAFQEMGKRTGLADALHQAGRIDEARDLFEQAEQMQKQGQPQLPLLYSVQGYLYCELLLDAAERAGDAGQVRSRAADVRQRASTTLEWAKMQGASLLDIALDHLAIGRAVLIECLHGGESTFARAAAQIDTAVDKIREAGAIHHLPRGLLVRAALYRAAVEHGDPSSIADAERDLDEVIDIATRDAANGGTLKLFLCNAHLEYARLRLAPPQPDVDAAREHVEKAAALIDECEYHRRDHDLAELRKRLPAASPRTAAQTPQ